MLFSTGWTSGSTSVGSVDGYNAFSQLFLTASAVVLHNTAAAAATHKMCIRDRVYVGNIMPKFRMNWYCGIKTPWTLSSESVWTRTHRLGGRLFFAAGLIGLLGSFVPNDTARFVLVLVPILAAAIIPTVFSYLWYRAEQ